MGFFSSGGKQGYSSLQHVGVSLRWLLLWTTGSRPTVGAVCRLYSVRASVVLAPGLHSCGTWALERRFSSCSEQA